MSPYHGETRLGKDSIRLYLSGGGHRAVLGGVGAIAALVDLDEWSHVREIVSVSGGSFPNAALVANAPTASTDGPIPALASMVDRLIGDGLRPFATARRTATVLAIGGVASTAIAAMLLAIGIGPWTPPRWVALVAGMLAAPLALVAIRRLAAAGFRDFISVVVGTAASRDLTSAQPERTHLFCAAGLSSGVPYTLWAGPTPPDVTWGECLQQGYTVRDAALASSSLPGLGCVTAPTALRRELLVDGGVIGIFGQQVHDPVNRRAIGARVRKVSVDAGRHSTADGPFGVRLVRWSALYALSRWLKVSLEATYVNDLDDAKGDTLIRLCWDRSMEPTTGRLGPVLDLLARRTSSLGLRDLGSPGALDALLSGFAHTMVALCATTSSADIEAALDRLGQQFELDLRQRWDDALADAAKLVSQETQ